MAERFFVECSPPDDHQPAWLKELEQFEAAFRVAVILAEPDRMVLLRLPNRVDGHLMTRYPNTATCAAVDQAEIMSEQNGPSAAPSNQVGLDDLITVKGEYTTIRNEHRVGYVTGMLIDDDLVTGRGTYSHWALIDGESFSVSAESHAFLQSEPFPHPTCDTR